MWKRPLLLSCSFLAFWCLAWGWPLNAQAAKPPVPIYFFWTEYCPHCAQEKEFLGRLQRTDKNIRVVALEISTDQENLELLRKVGKALNVHVPGVPFTVIGRQYVVGWQDDQTSGRIIERALQEARDREVPDVVAKLQAAAAPAPPASMDKKPVPETLTLPFFGEIQLKYLSLGLLTIIIGLLDGFNPCAMWVLFFLINLLLGMGDRKKMWTLEGAFILASGAVYFLLMTAWLNILIFFGFIFWIRIIIGLVALFAGGYNLKEYWTDTSGTCTLSEGDRRQHTMGRIKEIIQTRKFWWALIGIVLLAFMVNLVELICSAGFPVVYLQILSLTPLPFWQYYLYILLYIAVFMLDDIVVFVAAMITLQMLGVTTRYKRLSHLIGGLLMLVIGVLLIFRPGWLLFG